MFRLILILAAAVGVMVLSNHAIAQATRPAIAGKDYSNSPIVTRMMRFDVKNDGKLTRDEVTDDRLKRLFDEADANHDGIVTRDELMAVAAKLDADEGDDTNGPAGGSTGGPPGRGGRGGPGGRGGFGRGGPAGIGRGQNGGPGGAGGPPVPGLILSPGVQEMLGLSAQQRNDLANLQTEVDARLAVILTDAQKQQMRTLAARGPGGPRGGGPPPEN